MRSPYLVVLWCREEAQAKRMTQPIEALDDLGQYLKERQAIGVVFHDELAPIPAGGDMAEGACEFDANGRATVRALPAKQRGSFLPRSASSNRRYEEISLRISEFTGAPGWYALCTGMQ